MSVQAISCALALRNVSSSEKLLLLVLANYADEHMQCWPSQRKLALDTSLSERTVRSLLASLEGRHVLSRMEMRRADGSRATDRFTLHLTGEAAKGTEQQPAMVSGGGEVTAGGTGSDFRGVPEMVSGLTTFEPSSEPLEEDANASFVVSAKPKPTDDDVRLAFEEWNALAERLGLPKARKLDDGRRKAIRTRLADGGLGGWREALAGIQASEHCRGDNDRHWRADLDFVCTASKYRRLREGSYGAGGVTAAYAPSGRINGATGPPVLKDEAYWAALRARVVGDPPAESSH